MWFGSWVMVIVLVLMMVMIVGVIFCSDGGGCSCCGVSHCCSGFSYRCSGNGDC